MGAAGYKTIAKAYEIEKIGKILDWINLMAMTCTEAGTRSLVTTPL